MQYLSEGVHQLESTTSAGDDAQQSALSRVHSRIVRGDRQHTDLVTAVPVVRTSLPPSCPPLTPQARRHPANRPLPRRHAGGVIIQSCVPPWRCRFEQPLTNASAGVMSAAVVTPMASNALLIPMLTTTEDPSILGCGPSVRVARLKFCFNRCTFDSRLEAVLVQQVFHGMSD